MCGIVGYVGGRPVRELLLSGLAKLEYRGYDSAGISVIADGHIEAVRAVGNLSALQAKLDAGSATVAAGGPSAVAVASQPATTGTGHTRWASPSTATGIGCSPSTAAGRWSTAMS